MRRCGPKDELWELSSQEETVDTRAIGNHSLVAFQILKSSDVHSLATPSMRTHCSEYNARDRARLASWPYG